MYSLEFNIIAFRPPSVCWLARPISEAERTQAPGWLPAAAAELNESERKPEAHLPLAALYHAAHTQAHTVGDRSAVGYNLGKIISICVSVVWLMNHTLT